MSEEKKLTDEEIVELLDICPTEEYCTKDDCPLRDTSCHHGLMVSAKQLIHRLQSENEKLKCKKILAYKVLSDSTLKNETKADLIERIRILEHNWSCADERYNNSVKFSEKIIAEQQAEIERLNDMKFTQEHCDLYKENEWLKASLQQAVKDTVEKFAGLAKAKARWMRDHHGDYTAVEIDDIDEIAKEITEGKV